MPYTVTRTALPEVLILEPRVLSDDRGFFYESFNAKDFEKATRPNRDFFQDNHSWSTKGVLRGLHYQIQHPQGKLVRVTHGEVFDVAVDLRPRSPTFGKHVGITLSAQNKRQLWVREDFAHGFFVVSDTGEFVYKTSDYWYPEYERTLLWNDPSLGIRWALSQPLRLTTKDAAGKRL